MQPGPPVNVLCQRCGTQLSAAAGTPSVQCPQCGNVVGVQPGPPPGAAAPGSGNKTALIVVGVLFGGGGIAALALSAGDDGYIKRSKTTEARQFVKKIYDGARVYYMDAYVPAGMTPVPRQFPGPSTGLVPPDPTACCEKCAPDASLWEDEVWVALQFSVDDPHYNAYQYIVSDDRQSFTVRAHGDLDCDGTWSTFEMYGTIGPDGDPVAGAAMFRDKELE